MADVEIRAGVLGFTLPNMATIRFAGIAEPPADAHGVYGALARAGFGRLRVYDGAVVLPGNWPHEDLPPLRTGEAYLRGEGRWEGTADPVAHVDVTGGGAFTVFNAWVHENYAGPSTTPPSPGATNPPTPSAGDGPGPDPKPGPSPAPGPFPGPMEPGALTAGADLGVAVGVSIALVVGIAIAAARRSSAADLRAARPAKIAGDKQLATVGRYIGGLRRPAVEKGA
ncbi:MAG: hypothetical protein ABTD50_16470 [Polyangiaceae bacterium]|jgi:hypothetical protein